MVATVMPSAAPRVALVTRSNRFDVGAVQFTFEQALAMTEAGVLPEDITIELLNGTLVFRDCFGLDEGQRVEGFQHNYVVALIADLAIQINSDTRHLRSQSTFLARAGHAPIPDAIILRGRARDYRDIPKPPDALCVIEVADSSYERDVGEKLTGYARAGVQQYIVINLRNRTAEIYTTPDIATGTYPPPVIIAEAGTLALRVGDAETFDVPLASLLP